MGAETEVAWDIQDGVRTATLIRLRNIAYEAGDERREPLTYRQLASALIVLRLRDLKNYAVAQEDRYLLKPPVIALAREVADGHRTSP